MWLLLGCVGNEIVVRSLPPPTTGDTGPAPTLPQPTGTPPDTGTPLPTGDPVWLALLDVDCPPVPGRLAPGFGEDGHLTAAVLTPPATPFHVTEVVARMATTPLSSGETCEEDRPQRVELYVSGPTPPATPAPVAVLDFPAGAGSDGVRELTAAVDPPVVLGPGDRLVVAFEFQGTWPDVGCLVACPGSTSEAWWSNAPTPPYTWQSLDSFGLTNTPYLVARGYPAP